MCTLEISRSLVCMPNLDEAACNKLYVSLRRTAEAYVQHWADRLRVDPVPCLDLIEERLKPAEQNGVWTIVNRVRRPNGQYERVDIMERARSHAAPERALRAYVRNLCRATVRQQARRVERRRRGHLDEWAYGGPPDDPECEHRDLIKCLLAQLPETESRALRVYYLSQDAPTQRVAAARLGSSRDSLQTVLKRALDNCRKIAAQRGWDTR